MTERRRPGRPKARAVTRDEVIRTAVDRIDADGYQAFSLRQLADSLGVTVSTIIHHVGQRTEVLVAVVDHLLREAVLDPRTGAEAADDWRDGVRLVAGAYREVLLRHPRAATLILDVARRSPAGIEASMRLLMLLRRGGVPVHRLLATHTAIVGFVTGFSLQQGGEGLIGNEHQSSPSTTRRAPISHPSKESAGDRLSHAKSSLDPGLRPARIRAAHAPGKRRSQPRL